MHTSYHCVSWLSRISRTRWRSIIILIISQIGESCVSNRLKFEQCSYSILFLSIFVWLISSHLKKFADLRNLFSVRNDYISTCLWLLWLLLFLLLFTIIVIIIIDHVALGKICCNIVCLSLSLFPFLWKKWNKIILLSHFFVDSV